MTLILQDKIPFATSHLPTFLKLIHDPTWATRSRLLRLKKRIFMNFRNTTNHSLRSHFLDLKKENSFYYHFYYSGPHSNIDFDPYTWAQKNNFSVNKICRIPGSYQIYPENNARN